MSIDCPDDLCAHNGACRTPERSEGSTHNAIRMGNQRVEGRREPCATRTEQPGTWSAEVLTSVPEPARDRLPEPKGARASCDWQNRRHGGSARRSWHKSATAHEIWLDAECREQLANAPRQITHYAVADKKARWGRRPERTPLLGGGAAAGSFGFGRRTIPERPRSGPDDLSALTTR